MMERILETWVSVEGRWLTEGILLTSLVERCWEERINAQGVTKWGHVFILARFIS